MAVAGVGFLKQVSDKVRLYVDEPSGSSVWTDAQILEVMRRAYADVLDDVNRASSNRIRARIDITVVANTREYHLPPNMGTFLEFKKLDSDGNLDWEMIPRHPLNPIGPGFTIEGPRLRLDPVWGTGETMRIEYIPTGEAPIFEDTSASGATTSLITASGTVTAGSVDPRPNAYVGYVLNTLDSAGAILDQSVISSHTTGSAPAFTLKPVLAVTPADTVPFEVVPQHAYRFQDLIALKSARFIASTTGEARRVRSLQLEYSDAIRSMRLRAANTEGRVGQRFHRSIRSRFRWGKTV